MPSRKETIDQAQKANSLKNSAKLDDESIAKKLGVSKKRVEEYLARNSHSLNCPICRGRGVRDRLSTGSRRPICAND